MSDWTWEYELQPSTERLREALCTLGNGHFATRGAVPECEQGLVRCREPTWPGATTVWSRPWRGDRW